MAAVKGTLRVACFPGEARIAVYENGHLLDFAIWTPGHPDGTGDVHRGRVTARLPAMGGVFVALDGDSEGFLSDRDGAAGLNEGDAVPVRIIRAGMGGKGPRLRAAPLPDTLAGPPTLLARGPSPLEELAARWDGPIMVDSPVFMARIPAALRERVQRVPDAWDADVTDAVEALFVAEVDLPGGMRASLTPTPALVAIDMDTGAGSGAAQPKQTAQFALNRDALPALCDQIRLRNLSGAILIDPAGLAVRKRQALLAPLTEALNRDPLRPRCLGVTALGLFEIVRARVRPPLHESVAAPHGRAMAALRDVVAQCAARTGATPIGRAPCLRAGLGLIRALEGDSLALEDVAFWCGQPLHLAADAGLSFFSWVVEHD